MQFRLMSPGTGAYRVQLSQISGQEAAEAVIAGKDDEMRVDLPPGEYWGRVLELGQPTGSGRRFKLQLQPGEPQVRLPSIPTVALALSSRSGALNPAIRSTRLPRLSQLTETKPRERSLATQSEVIATPPQQIVGSTDFSVESIGLPRELRGGVVDLPVLHTSIGFEQETRETLRPMTLRARSERLPFAIGMSEDRSPEKQGNWTRPSLVEISVEVVDDGFRVHLSQRQERVPIGGYRIRMTVGIAGVPAIRIPVPIYAEGSIIEVRPLRTGDQQLDFAVEIKATNERVQALVAALTELPSEEALKILCWNAETQIEDAIATLAQKRSDLWAATAAALLLVKARRLDSVGQWPLNLSRLAPHIADGAIAAAWARAAQETDGRRNTEQAVMKLLNQGLSVGAPTFSTGNSLALEMLNALRSTAMDREVQSSAREAYVRLARRSRYKIYRGPYMVWEQTGHQLQSGRLLGPRYLELVRGKM